MKDQDEMFESATETPAFLGCPQHMPTQLPSGFDGVEPASPSDEAKSKVEAIVLRQLEVLNKIVDIALAADAKACKQETKLGSKYLECSKAICSIRELCGPYLAKNLQGGEGVQPSQRKPTMDFGSFHVTRAAIPGTTILTFRRKRHVDAEHGSVVPGRIIVAKIFKADVGAGNKLTNQFVVKSYEAGENTRVLFSGQTWVSMSKTEKMVYKMVKCNVKETQRRHISRKRARAALRDLENGGRA